MSAVDRRLSSPVRINVQGWLNRARRLAGGVSIRAKILGIVLSLTVVLGLGVTWEVRTVMHDTFIGELESRGFSVVNDLAARSIDPVLLNDNFALFQLLNETIDNHADALYAFVLTGDGQVLVHTFGDEGFPTALLSLTDRIPGRANGGVEQLSYRSDQGVVHDFAAPLLDGQAGTVHLGLTETRLRTTINDVTRRMLLTTLAVAVAGILAASLLTWLLTRPIMTLVETTREVGRGNLAVRADHWADDEVGDLADAFNEMVADLQISQAAIAEKDAARSRLLEKLITAQEEERKRIARELHDGVGQALTSIIVGLKVASQADDMETMRAKSAALSAVATETLDDVRLLSRELRPSVLDDLGLAAALERFTTEFIQLHPHIHVDIHCTLPHRLPASVEITLYRIIQEAMTNAARHSGCHTISVLAAQRNDRVQAIIEDDGHGFDPEITRRMEGSVGLHAMAERIELLGGTLDIESSLKGTTVYVEAPI